MRTQCRGLVLQPLSWRTEVGGHARERAEPLESPLPTNKNEHTHPAAQGAARAMESAGLMMLSGRRQENLLLPCGCRALCIQCVCCGLLVIHDSGMLML